MSQKVRRIDSKTLELDVIRGSGTVKQTDLIDGTVANGQRPVLDNINNVISGPSSGDKKETVVKLKKQITLSQSVAIIVGIIIGSGIFVSPVGILSNVRSVGMSCVMWAVCGVFSGLCALCYAELGACIPQSGGEYIYIKRAFGDFPAFLCLWINFIIICPVGIAASSLIFSTYILQPIFPDCDPPSSALRLLSAVVVGKFKPQPYTLRVRQSVKYCVGHKQHWLLKRIQK